MTEKQWSLATNRAIAFRQKRGMSIAAAAAFVHKIEMPIRRSAAKTFGVAAALEAPLRIELGKNGNFTITGLAVDMGRVPAERMAGALAETVPVD